MGIRKYDIDPVAALCPSCGLCCNGVIFSDVKLKACDRKVMADLGVEAQKGRLPQPCAAFDGKTCRIYDQRPDPCRKFDCRLVQRVRKGKMGVSEALRAIRYAKAAVTTVDKLLRELGQIDVLVPLSRRFSNVMAEPLDLSNDGRVAQLRHRLATAIDKLAARLGRDFLS